MNDTAVTTTGSKDEPFEAALSALEATLGKVKGCSDLEREKLEHDFAQLRRMIEKLSSGRVEIVVFGEISTGKSALINALVGESVTEVDVRGGWTKDVWKIDWDGIGYCVPGFADSQVVLVDTPGLNEVGGADHATLAREAAEQADLILFVTDKDLTESENTALHSLVELHKPIIVVLNKTDLYRPEERERLLDVLTQDRLKELVPAEQVVSTAADPREVEYIVESATGETRSEWRKPEPNIEELKELVLKMLEADGLALIALNAAMYASDKSDRIASLRIELRERQARQVIWSYASIKAMAVGLNPIGVADVLGGSAVDATMIATLAKVYGLEMSWTHAKGLAASILKAAGWVLLAETATHVAAATLKVASVGLATLLTAVPQGAAAGYASYIVGQAAKYYFEHGSSWGGESPKAVVRRILDETDKSSVLEHLKDEIRQRISKNPHAEG